MKLFRACCLGSRWHKYKMCVRGGVRIFLCAGFHGSVPSEKPVLGVSVVFFTPVGFVSGLGSTWVQR